MKYFTFEEFEKSDTAKKLGIDNTIPKECKGNIEALVDTVLDPLREAYNKPINISSGYRTRELNAKLKGSSTSQHCKGEAADLVVKDGKKGLKDLMVYILYFQLPIDQAIFEVSGNSVWLHVSHKRNGVNRNQFLTYLNGAYTVVTPEYMWSVICGLDLPILHPQPMPITGCNMK